MPPYTDTDTITQAPVTHLLAAVTEPERPRRRHLCAIGLICAYAGTAAWVAVCVKVILVAWG